MLERWYFQLTSFALGHLQPIAVAFAATLLAIYGGDLTRFVRRRTRAWPFLARAVLFVVVVGLGFGALVLALTPLVGRALLAFGRAGVLPAVLAAVVGLGLLAERRRQL